MMSAQSSLPPTLASYKDIPRRLALGIVKTLVQLAIVFGQLTTVIGKLATDGLIAYFQYFTNWVLLAQLLFYTATLGAGFLGEGLIGAESALGRLTLAVVGLFYFALNGILWTVAILVILLLITEAGFFLQLLQQMLPGELIVGNEVFHFVPLPIVLLFFIMHRKVIYFAHNFAIVHFKIYRSMARFTLYILFQGYVISGTFAAIYTILFNPHRVYGTTVPTGAGIAVALIALTAFNFVPFLIILALANVGNPIAYSRWWLVRNDADPSTDFRRRTDEQDSQ